MSDATARLALQRLREERQRIETEILNGCGSWDRYKWALGRRQALVDAEKVVEESAKNALTDD